MKKLISILSLFCLVLLTNCGKKEEGKRETPPRKSCCCQALKINIGGEPRSLDPRKARSLGDVNISKMFMEGLCRSDKSGKPALAMAEKVAVSDDLMTYTFKLRDAKWSNGDKVTAEDFVYSWKKTLSRDFPADYSANLFVIKNAKSIKEGKLPLSFLGVSVHDESTLVVHLESPTPYFLELTTMPIFFPINAKVEKTNYKWANRVESFVGNGPFLPKTWNHHDKLVAVKNPSYWDQKAVQLEEIEMVMIHETTALEMFEKGELHWQGSPHSFIPTDAIAALKRESKLKECPALSTNWIRINVSKAPLNHPHLRKALALAIDRKSLVEHVTQGGQIPSTGIVPISMGLQKEPYFNDCDAEGAQNSLNVALSELNLTRETLPQLTLSYGGSERSHLTAQAVQQQIRENLGIEIALERMETKTFFDKIRQQNYMMAISDWIADYNDPTNFLEIFYSKDNGVNNTGWENELFQDLLDESYTISNEPQRKELLAKCESILVNEMPVIPLYTSAFLYVQDDHLENVVLTDLGSIDFKWAKLKP